MSIPKDCRAMVLTGDRQFELRQIPLPQKLLPGQILLKVEGCGICGSDIEQYEGGLARAGIVQYPVIPGHETVGRIAALSAEAAQRRGLVVGDRVAVHGSVPCGVCVNCVNGQRCVEAFYCGFRRLDVGCGLWGGYAEYMLIEPNTKLYSLPSSLSIEDAVLFNPLAAGFDWVIQQGGVKLGDTVLILGPGQRGLACVTAAAQAGAAQIIVTGLARDQYKLNLALELGATAALVVEHVDTVSAALELTNGKGVDCVIDTTPQVFRPVEDAIAAVRKGGTVVLAGLKAEKTMNKFPLDAVMHKQLRVVGALASSDWAVKQAINCIASERFPLQKLHTHSVPLAEAAHAIEMLAGHVEGEAPIHITIVCE